uniref:Uncharacterized protein n=1 Tax=Suricata suricatta TaxID=37032 RepID=A0A673TR12_SURSU
IAKCLEFIARIVMVQEGDMQGASRTLRRILAMDGLIEDAKGWQYYEKPCAVKPACRSAAQSGSEDQLDGRIGRIGGRAAEACG